jgi:hypothetical protein
MARSLDHIVGEIASVRKELVVAVESTRADLAQLSGMRSSIAADVKRVAEGAGAAALVAGLGIGWRRRRKRRASKRIGVGRFAVTK